MSAVPVHLFADFTCPFSYIVEVVLWRMGDEVAPSYHAYELFPVPATLPPGALDDSVAVAQALAAEIGISIRPPASLARTRKAHELARFAAGTEHEQPLREMLYRAVFEQGRDIGRVDLLVAIAESVGLDRTEARVVLDIDQFSADIAHDARLAHTAEVESVPTLFIGTGEPLRATGAWPPAELHAMIRGT